MVNQMVYEGTTQDNATLDNVYLGRSACEFGQCYRTRCHRQAVRTFMRLRKRSLLTVLMYVLRRGWLAKVWRRGVVRRHELQLGEF
jgi:hypothetical protein